MREEFDLVVVLPVGPGCDPGFVADTIESIKFYVSSTCRIIIADDSQKGIGRSLQFADPHIDVLETPGPMGKLCGLYLTLSLAFAHALKKYQFKALLRMDTDALIIGPSPEQHAFELFEKNPLIGMAGQYPLDYDGRPWDISWPKEKLRRMMHTWRFFRRPLSHATLLPWYRKALSNGYLRGESVFGGACFYSYRCLIKLQSLGLLGKSAFRTLRLEEDHLFSILVRAAGFQFGSLSGDNQPFACAWKGLPASPEELEKHHKKIIHSTRYQEQLREGDIRIYFKNKRLLVKAGLKNYLINS